MNIIKIRLHNALLPILICFFVAQNPSVFGATPPQIFVFNEYGYVANDGFMGYGTIKEGVLHPLRVVGFSSGCDDLVSHNHDGIEENGMPDPELEDAACSLISAFPTAYQNSFKVFDYGMYPPLVYIDRGEAHDLAFNCMKEKVETTYNPPYYLLLGKQINPEDGSVEFRVALKLPRYGAFADMNSTLENAFNNQVLEAMEAKYADLGSLLLLPTAENAGIEKLKELLLAFLNGDFNGGLTEALLQMNGFREIPIDSNYIPNIQNTNTQNLSSTNLKDYAGLLVYYNLSGTFDTVSLNAQLGMGDFTDQFGLTTGAIITENANYRDSTNSFELANANFENMNQNIVLWIHYFVPSDSTQTIKLFYKYKSNMSLEQAGDIMDEEYQAFLSGNGGVARPNDEETEMRSANCDLDEKWRAHDCLLPNIGEYVDMLPQEILLNESSMFVGGITCGVIDGVVETLVFVSEMSEGIENALEKVPLTISWWNDVFKKTRKQKSFFRAIGAKFTEDIEYWKLTIQRVWDIVTVLASVDVKIVIKNIIDEFITWIGTLAFQNGTAEAGYEYGKIIFDIVISFLTGGTNYARKFSKKFIEEFIKEMVNAPQGFKRVLNAAWNSNKVKESQRIICKLFLGGCFINGTPIWTASGPMAIEQLKPVFLTAPVPVFSNRPVFQPSPSNFQNR